MPRTEITVSAIIRNPGTTPPTAVNSDPTNNHMFVNDGRTYLEAVNQVASSKTITLRPFLTVDGVAVTVPLTLAASATLLIGPFPTTIYSQVGGADDGKMYFDVSGSASDVKFRAYRLP